MSVVAEGMERVEQANFLLARGCRLMQGFLFARPVPAAEFTQTLRNGLVMPPGLRLEGDTIRSGLPAVRAPMAVGAAASTALVACALR